MTKEKIEKILIEYGVPFTDALADRLLQEWEKDIDHRAEKYEQAFMDGFESAVDLYERNKVSQPQGDLISRQLVEQITWEEPTYSDPLNVLTEVRDKVRALPSSQPDIEAIRQDIKKRLYRDSEWNEWVIRESDVMDILDKHLQKDCSTCKHYFKGEHDGSCGSYICENYSGWEGRVNDRKKIM